MHSRVIPPGNCRMLPKNSPDWSDSRPLPQKPNAQCVKWRLWERQWYSQDNTDTYSPEPGYPLCHPRVAGIPFSHWRGGQSAWALRLFIRVSCFLLLLYLRKRAKRSPYNHSPSALLICHFLKIEFFFMKRGREHRG